MKITAKEAAEKWGISLRSVQGYCKSGKIPGAEYFGHNWMIPVEAQRPQDGRRKKANHTDDEKGCRGGSSSVPGKRATGNQSSILLRQSPFLDMTDLYHQPGMADKCIEALSNSKETQTLFSATIHYSRGEIDQVYAHAKELLDNHTDFYVIVSGGILLSLVAMWKGDIRLWNEARRHLLDAPCEKEVDTDILALSVAAVDSAIRDTDDFPDWFARGCFDRIPKDSHPAARVYYARHLMVMAQDLAMGSVEIEGVRGLALMKVLPYAVEPMISQTVLDGVVLAEIYLRLIGAVIYRQGGNDAAATEHLDKAIALCLADDLYGPLVEHRRQLGSFLDKHIALADPMALKEVKRLYKQLHAGWTKIHNAVLKKTVAVHLSPREREVARLVCYGLSDAQIAMRLSISESSVKTLIRAAKDKTGAEKRKQLLDFV